MRLDLGQLAIRVGGVHAALAGQQPSALGVVARDVDHGPRHANGAVDNGVVGLGSDARRGELRLVVRRREAVEPEHRMDAGDRKRDVRHVGRPRDPLREVRRHIQEPAAQLLRVRAVVAGDDGVVIELAVRGAGLHCVDAASGCQRACVEAPQDLRFELSELAGGSANGRTTAPPSREERCWARRRREGRCRGCGRSGGCAGEAGRWRSARP